MSLKEFKKNYIEFLENLPKYLKKAKELLKKEYIDYSYDEIEEFIKLYAENYKNPNGISYYELSNVLYAYLGTAFVNYQGGNWELSEVKTDEAYGTPTIVNWGGKDYPWTRCSPFVWKLIIEENGNLRRPIHRVFA
ncbi:MULTISPECIES: hypothetical protein [Mesonia]|uniref:Uncharacterized protein n=1 Tax=Mesonia oceanica TaxID=2687242 RepID=A0AC61Y7D6_9FLAO|nr:MULTISPECIES: hypothetical protein [Mesonia]MAN26758.1 hypothetical protein [Mesonia sp.]MAQ40462.1 hypothetical protein [Mesonia sp.]MBJ98083.1 hypothetical protein [Flavobacteriaceae bacterium]VVV00300.1 hypothetical protein FVB9532_01569 [Mesonia oceanica]|tara:strand:- start:137 stop:544 length:408 start_codon:yes stop_codon:yes gene_type:complete